MLKTLANVVACVVVLPAAATAWLEGQIHPHGEAFFGFWGHVFAVLPGPPGMYLRRAFYCLALESCALDSHVGFGVIFTHRRARVEPGVYIGPYTLIGCGYLRRGCLIGSRVSVVSGRNLHKLQPDGTWGPSDLSTLEPIEIGEHAWIGEAATLLADVGPGSMVGAGSVVASTVPPRVMVAGNPARFIRVLQPSGASASLETAHAAGIRRVD